MHERVAITDVRESIEATLTIYRHEVETEIERVTAEAMKDLVSRTKATAPVGKRKKFRAAISSKRLEEARGAKYVWYVKEPEHRLTHLLVHGHATREGGRTKANPFLKNALDVVLPEYEAKVKEAIQSVKGD